MASLNKKPVVKFTHEGGKAKHINAALELERTVMACMLWERSFYESGESIVDRIQQLVAKVAPKKVAELAIKARYDMKLRHVPLLLVSIMVKLPAYRPYVSDTLFQIINRPDEMAEFLAMYWKDGKCPVANSVKRGLASCFLKFNEYQFSKWNRPNAIKLRDVMFICHPKPVNKKQEDMFKRIADDTLEVPDTWEVALSSGADKQKTWTRLLEEKKLGGMALIRNLRNMENVGVDKQLVKKSITEIKSNFILPFRYIAAAKYAPKFEPELEYAMFNSLVTHDKLKGNTVLLIDVSGSMWQSLSSKSDMLRIDTACGLAMLLREICEDIDIYTFSLELKSVAPRRGFALRDAIINSQDHSGTYLGHAVKNIYAKKGSSDRFSGYYRGHLTFKGQGLSPERLIVITDEQSADKVPNPKGKGYMMNVASYQNGVGYGAWTHIDGFSESCVKWLQAMENCAFL